MTPVAFFRIKQLLLGWWAGGCGYPRLTHNLRNQCQEKQGGFTSGRCHPPMESVGICPPQPARELSRVLGASSSIPPLASAWGGIPGAPERSGAAAPVP